MHVNFINEVIKKRGTIIAGDIVTLYSVRLETTLCGCYNLTIFLATTVILGNTIDIINI